MTLIGWIIRIIAILILVRLVLRFLAGIVRGLSSPASGQSRRSAPPATREGGHLVRDPHCGTYVPVGRALREGSGDSAIYFCSENCRNAWSARKAG
jgi:uncharacterized protein